MSDPVVTNAIDQSDQRRAVGVCEPVEYCPRRHRVAGAGEVIEQPALEERRDLAGEAGIRPGRGPDQPVTLIAPRAASPEARDVMTAAFAASGRHDRVVRPVPDGLRAPAPPSWSYGSERVRDHRPYPGWHLRGRVLRPGQGGEPCRSWTGPMRAVGWQSGCSASVARM